MTLVRNLQQPPSPASEYDGSSSSRSSPSSTRSPPRSARPPAPAQPPNVLDPLGVIQNTVNQLSMSFGNESTRRAYGGMISSFKGFCDYQYHQFESQDRRHLVTGEKFFLFMFYHVFHSKKAVCAGARAGGFDATDYCSVLERFMAEQQIIQQAAQNGTLTESDIPDPEDPVGWSVIEHAISGVKHLYNEQKLHGMNNIPWDSIRTPMIDNLIKLVRGRRRRVNKRNYAEKVDETTSAFENVHRMEDIELEFWCQGRSNCTGK